MPRLRLRVASTNVTYKLELPQHCTWAGLLAETRRAVGLSPDVDVVLSLNKKTPLHGSPGDPWSSPGICGGDLVWLLTPALMTSSPTHTTAPDTATAAGAAATPAAAARCSETTVPMETAAAPSIPSKSPRPSEARGVAAAATAGPAEQEPACARPPDPDPDPGPGGAGGGIPGGSGGVNGGVRDVDGAAVQALWAGAGSGGGVKADFHGDGDGGDDVGGDEAEAVEAQHVGLPAIRGVSLKLLRLLVPTRATSAATTFATNDSNAVVTRGPGPSAASTTNSNSGDLNPVGASDGGGGGGCRTDWVSLPAATRCLLVLDCAMAEGGFEGLQDLPAFVGQTGGTTPRQLLYGCSFLSESAGGCRDGDQEMTEAAFSGDGDGGSGATAAAASAPVVKLLWYSMGRYLVVHGVPCISRGGSAAAAASGRLSPVTLHIDLAEYGSGAASAASGGDGCDGSLSTSTQLPPDPAGHWRRLKDGLVLPLLAAACRTAGVSPPLGLTVLPLELQMAVLRRLEARDLAVLSCACTALHQLTSEDELWRPLCDKEFGPVPGPGASAADAALANSRGYKYLYGRKWRERVERRKRRQVFWAAHRPHRPPGWGPPPLGPFVRPPYMPPGSIGGDYDRLPPPLMGGAPPAIMGSFGSGSGMFTGGGGGFGGGGGLFPGSGPRRLGPWGSSGGSGLGSGGFL